MPSAEKLQQIADLLGVTVDFLMTGKEETDEKGILMATLRVFTYPMPKKHRIMV